MLKGACRVSLAVGNYKLLGLVSGLRGHWGSQGSFLLELQGLGRAWCDCSSRPGFSRDFPSRCSHLPCWEGEVLNWLLWSPGACGGCGRTSAFLCFGDKYTSEHKLFILRAEQIIPKAGITNIPAGCSKVFTCRQGRALKENCAYYKQVLLTDYLLTSRSFLCL